MYQQVTLIGNLGRDPEMRYTPTGVPVTNFSIAVTRTWVNQDGQRQEKTIWFRVVAWRKLAELCSQYLTKGNKVLVVGQLEEPSTFTDRDGKTRVSLEVTADTVRFLTPKGEGEPALHAAPVGAGESREVSDEDIPF